MTVASTAPDADPATRAGIAPPADPAPPPGPAPPTHPVLPADAVSGGQGASARVRPPRPPVRELLFIGLLLLTGLILEVVLLALWDPAIARGAVIGIVTEVFAGREGGVVVALQAGVPPVLAWQLSVTQDITAVAITFPLVAHLLDRYHDSVRLPMRIVRRMERSALRHHRSIERWGPPGIFIFMLMPFLVNGPLIAATAGHLAHVPGKRLTAAIIAASMVAAAAWVWFFDATRAIVERVGGPYAALGFTIAILALIVGGWALEHGVALVRARRARRRP